MIVLTVLCVSSTRMGELRDLHGAWHASTVLARGAVGDGCGILASASWVDLLDPFGYAPGSAIETVRSESRRPEHSVALAVHQTI